MTDPVKFTALPAGSAMDGTEILAGVQGGVSKKFTRAQITLTEAGILITAGAPGGPVLASGLEISALVPAQYEITGWKLWVAPTGSISIDLRRTTFAGLPPDSGDTIVASAPPAVTTALSASGSASTWTTKNLLRGDALTARITSITDVEWFALLLEATR
jgi:hypothetical protein